MVNKGPIMFLNILLFCSLIIIVRQFVCRFIGSSAKWHEKLLNDNPQNMGGGFVSLSLTVFFNINSFLSIDLFFCWWKKSGIFWGVKMRTIWCGSKQKSGSSGCKFVWFVFFYYNITLNANLRRNWYFGQFQTPAALLEGTAMKMNLNVLF